jgi:hypothetical protein
MITRILKKNGDFGKNSNKLKRETTQRKKQEVKKNWQNFVKHSETLNNSAQQWAVFLRKLTVSSFQWLTVAGLILKENLLSESAVLE